MLNFILKVFFWGKNMFYYIFIVNVTSSILANTRSIGSVTHNFSSVIYLLCVICRLVHMNKIYIVYTLE